MDSPTPASTNNNGQLSEEDSMLEDDEGSLLNTEQEEARRLLFDTTPTPHQHFDHLENIILSTASDVQGDIGTILTWVQDTAASVNEVNENIKTLVTINIKLQEEVTVLKGQNGEIRATLKKVLEEVNELRSNNSEVTRLLTQNLAPSQGARERQSNHMATATTHKTTTTLGPTFRPTLPPKAPTAKPAARPTDAHHPSRLVVRFVRTGVKEDDKEDPRALAERLNLSISSAALIRGLEIPPMVVAVNYNRTNSSLIVYVREDQAAADLLPFEEEIRRCILQDNPQGYELKIYVDKKWFKIQVDNVPTKDRYGYIFTSATLMEELTRNNATVSKLYQEERITMEPRWTRTMEDLMAQGTRRSSFIFGTDSEESANKIIKSKSLAVFGTYCDIRPYQDRPPVCQCNNCWNMGHQRKTCKTGETCRLCASKEHNEKAHTEACTKCLAIRESEGDMETELLVCDHNLRCTNCLDAGKEDTNHAANSRRCPIRLDAFGTARTNEKAAIRKGTPYQVVGPKKSRKKKTNKDSTMPPTTTTASGNTSNCFAALDDIDMDLNNSSTQRTAGPSQ
ncbi:hypothetical protein E1B28_005482 [Marasmius oreades]|uniref:Gag-like protein n=1 Tax=Marasmius oreades TaxID=181124 RepID=A0A9P7S386_9AGAR|nr:uncharacterized protein E1B28_005482 [Marasmius oreades]KAG7094659.1 hypothetical protein E1B28_005482 [Marasmius oreades]